MLPHFIPSIASTGFSSVGDVSGQGAGSGPTETVSLSGTSVSPVNVFGALPTWSGSEWVVDNSITINSNGNIYRGTYSNPTILLSSTQWNNTTPSQTYYLRATNVGSDVAPTSGDTLGSWLALSTSRGWTWYGTQNFGAYGQRSYTLKFEIASDSGGSNILATGYYRVQWEGGA